MEKMKPTPGDCEESFPHLCAVVSDVEGVSDQAVGVSEHTLVLGWALLVDSLCSRPGFLRVLCNETFESMRILQH